MAIAPPFYRNLNLNAEILGDKAELRAYQGSPQMVTAGDSFEFGSIAIATPAIKTLSYTTAGGLTDPITTMLVVQYTGDTGAFRLSKMGSYTLLDHTDMDLENATGLAFTAFAVNAELGFGGLDFGVTALAADDGVEKTGTLSFYWPYAGDIPGTLIGQMTLSKTYNAP